jgi:hypothetical protein
MSRSHYLSVMVCLIITGLLLVSCITSPGGSLDAQATPSRSPTATPLPLPALIFKPGEFYFSLEGSPAFIFSRNLAGYQPLDYEIFLDWSRTGGSSFTRIQLDSLGMGYTYTGAVDEVWAAKWERVFSLAEADGIYILPVFSGWFDWNAGTGYSTWKNNPMNQVNGGPVKSPDELFQSGSATQTLWFKWMETLVGRWQGRKNILGWEIFSEVNLASGVTETAGIAFIDSAAAIIRAADPSGRPVTASIADTGQWRNFYRKAAIDFINIHPYPPSGQLDRTIVSEVRASLTRYDRPVLIGESGLSAETPDSPNGRLTVAANAAYGVRHAIWAGVVSGAMNGRALYWEDSFGIYFHNLGIPWMQKYAAEELPAVNFVSGTDFDGFTPLTATTTTGVWGAAIGDDEMVLGWFRDAACDPPDWPLKTVISKQTVTLSIPGTAKNWRVDFYDTHDGTTILGSLFLTRQGNTLIIPLPDFQDDIAFKAHS